MLDIKLVREKTDRVVDALKKRGEDALVLDKFLKLENEKRAHLKIVEEQRERRNKVSEEIGKIKKQGKDVSTLLDDAKKISDEMAENEHRTKPARAA